MKKRILLVSALGIAAGVAFVKFYPTIKAKLSSNGKQEVETEEEVEVLEETVSAETTEDVVDNAEVDKTAFIEKIKSLSTEQAYSIVDLLDKEDKIILMEVLIKLGGIEGVKKVLSEEENMELVLTEKLTEEQYNKLIEMYEKYKEIIISL